MSEIILTPLTIFLAIIGIALIVWFFKLLKQAIEIKAIRGLADAIIVAVLWFLGIIFAILYLKIKIDKKLKSPKEIDKKKPKKPSKELSNIKKYWDKFWFLVWKDDSFQGWVLSIIFIFIFIKLIFFPALSLVTGTPLPLAIVESCSMYHDGNTLSNFDTWWKNHDSKYSQFTINNLDFSEFPFTRGFNKGDILFIIGAKPEKLAVGDVVIFNAGMNNPIIHRIISIENNNGEYTFSTIGDNNNAQLSLEKEISENQLVGKALPLRIPYIGWLKLIFYEPSRTASEKGFCDER